MSNESAGARFRAALAQESPLQIVGAINAHHALMATRVGYRALYLSGGGVAAGSLGMPDLGLNTLEDVLTDVRRITDVCPTPLLVDVDTGFGPSAFNIARTVRALCKHGAAAMHIEDQVGAKRCGHRPNKEIVPAAEMADRVKAAVDARTDQEFFVIARTDAIAIEGIDRAIERSLACVLAGADAIFAEAVRDIASYRRFVAAVSVPVLANLTEFGQTPLFGLEELRAAGVAMALYPLSAFRAMNKAALRVYETIRREGSQRSVVDTMQTREELYEVISYHEFERRLDRLFEQQKGEKRHSDAPTPFVS
ncbi:MAG TPA: methylisocitrate lyase [Burkholderiaceae bacterium]|nr:methylisocitrate lyase [Burkholderiaceae bacterium]